MDLTCVHSASSMDHHHGDAGFHHDRPWDYVMWHAITRPVYRNLAGHNVPDYCRMMLACLALPFCLWGLLPCWLLEDLALLLDGDEDRI